MGAKKKKNAFIILFSVVAKAAFVFIKLTNKNIYNCKTKNECTKYNTKTLTKIKTQKLLL